MIPSSNVKNYCRVSNRFRAFYNSSFPWFCLWKGSVLGIKPKMFKVHVMKNTSKFSQSPKQIFSHMSCSSDILNEWFSATLKRTHIHHCCCQETLQELFPMANEDIDIATSSVGRCVIPTPTTTACWNLEKSNINLGLHSYTQPEQLIIIIVERELLLTTFTWSK